MNESTSALEQPIRVPILWGLVVGLVQVASAPLLWWLDLSTVHALGITLIAAVYIGFAVADGRSTVLVIEIVVASVFVLLAAVAITGSAWILVIAFAGHGFKDVWQHRSHFVANTRWWPPFCCAVDWLVAGGLAIMIAAGVNFR